MALYKTKYPLSIYFLFIVLAIQAYFLINGSLFKLLFYTSLTFLFLYILFCRYACKVELFEDKVRFKYFFFWDNNICITFEGINSVDYEKSFYDFIDDKTLGGLYSFPKYCYDKIVFKMQKEEVEVLVNTRVFTFNKLFSFIRKKIRPVVNNSL